MIDLGLFFQHTLCVGLFFRCTSGVRYRRYHLPRKYPTSAELIEFLETRQALLRLLPLVGPQAALDICPRGAIAMQVYGTNNPQSLFPDGHQYIMQTSARVCADTEFILGLACIIEHGLGRGKHCRRRRLQIQSYETVLRHRCLERRDLVIGKEKISLKYSRKTHRNHTRTSSTKSVIRCMRSS